MKLGLRELIVFLLLLGFLGGSYVLGFKRVQIQRAFYQKDIHQKQETLTTLTRSAATLADLEAQLGKLQETITVFERKLPKQKDVGQVLEDVSTLCRKHGLRSASVKPLKAERAGGCSEQPIELAVDGPFPGFFAFLGELESSDRIIRITQLDIRKITDEKGPMQAKLTISIYFEPDPQQSTASAR